MFTRTTLFAMMTALAACAPLQRPFDSKPTVALLPKCAAQQTFSGATRTLRSDELVALSEMLGKYSKWQLEGISYEDYRLAETAVCACRDYKFVVEELRGYAENVQANNAFQDAKINMLDPIGPSIEVLASTSTPEATDRVRLVRPNHAPQCLVIQAVRAPESQAKASIFFSRLEQFPRETATPSIRATPQTPADRLRALEQLRRDGLLSEDEYKTRRNAVVEQL